MVRRWRARYWKNEAVIQTLPNGKPSLDPDVFAMWWEHYKQRYAELKEEKVPR